MAYTPLLNGGDKKKTLRDKFPYGAQLFDTTSGVLRSAGSMLVPAAKAIAQSAFPVLKGKETTDNIRSRLGFTDYDEVQNQAMADLSDPTGGQPHKPPPPPVGLLSGGTAGDAISRQQAAAASVMTPPAAQAAPKASAPAITALSNPAAGPAPTPSAPSAPPAAPPTATAAPAPLPGTPIRQALGEGVNWSPQAGVTYKGMQLIPGVHYTPSADGGTSYVSPEQQSAIRALSGETAGPVPFVGSGIIPSDPAKAEEFFGSVKPIAGYTHTPDPALVAKNNPMSAALEKAKAEADPAKQQAMIDEVKAQIKAAAPGITDSQVNENVQARLEDRHPRQMNPDGTVKGDGAWEGTYSDGNPVGIPTGELFPTADNPDEPLPDDPKEVGRPPSGPPVGSYPDTVPPGTAAPPAAGPPGAGQKPGQGTENKAPLLKPLNAEVSPFQAPDYIRSIFGMTPEQQKLMNEYVSGALSAQYDPQVAAEETRRQQAMERARHFWATKGLSESGFLAGSLGNAEADSAARLAAIEAQRQGQRLPMMLDLVGKERDFGLRERGQLFNEHVTGAKLPGELAGQALTNQSRELSNKAANEQLYRDIEWFKRVGFQPQELAMKREQLKTKLAELEYAIASDPNDGLMEQNRTALAGQKANLQKALAELDKLAAEKGMGYPGLQAALRNANAPYGGGGSSAPPLNPIVQGMYEQAQQLRNQGMSEEQAYQTLLNGLYSTTGSSAVDFPKMKEELDRMFGKGKYAPKTGAGDMSPAEQNLQQYIQGRIAESLNKAGRAIDIEHLWQLMSNIPQLGVGSIISPERAREILNNIHPNGLRQPPKKSAIQLPSGE